VVVANEPTSVMDAYSLIKVVTREASKPLVMMAVNMVRSLDEGAMLAERLNRITRRFLRLELPVAGIVTYDAVVGDAIRARRPLMEYAGGSGPARCIADMARAVVAGRRCAAAGSELSRGFFGKLADIGVDAKAQTDAGAGR